MRELELETLLSLLQLYETALAELRATGDEEVLGLARRLEQRQAEVIAAIAEKNSEAVASVRAAAFV